MTTVTVAAMTASMTRSQRWSTTSIEIVIDAHSSAMAEILARRGIARSSRTALMYGPRIGWVTTRAWSRSEPRR